MRKLISVVLVIVMVFSLAACASNGAGTSASPEASQSAAPSESPSAAPSEPAADSSAEVSATPGAVEKVGYLTDDVDNSARDPYSFVFMYSTATSISATFYNAMKAFEQKLNFTITSSCSDGDNDLYVNNLSNYALQGVDGFILNPDTNIMERVTEVCEDELQIPFILAFNADLDAEGHSLYPCVNLFAKDLGVDCMNWMLDNYKTYLGDIDLKAATTGYAFVTQSAIPDLVNRTYAAIDVLKERVGENAPYFIADCISTAVSEAGAYDALAPVISAHPEFENWIIFADMPDFANGAARAIEAAGKDDKTLLTCGGETLLIQVWEEADYDGCWKGAYAINNYLYVLPMLTGLIALCDGRATYDTLWADQRREGDYATLYSLATVMYTKENYKQILADVEKEVGFEISWY